MKTDNELIAEFMGLKSISKKEFEKCPEKYSIEKESIIEYQRYHVDWNWLMPVVDKIESTPFSNFLYSSPGYWVVIDGDSCEIKEDKLTIITKSKGVSKIDAVYKAVVEFIKWYNECRPESK